jgi:hypothetical protein
MKTGKEEGIISIFAKACFGHPSQSKRQKLNATANAFATTIVNSVQAVLSQV